MSQNHHQVGTGTWHMREAADWIVTAEDLYEQAGTDAEDTPANIALVYQQVQAATAIAQAHAALGHAVEQRHRPELP